MASNSLKLTYLFILVSCFNFPTTNAQGLTYINKICSTYRTTPNSVLDLNLKTLFSSFSSNATANNGFYNNTVPRSNTANAVYGLFMCRGDVPSQLCGQCVVNATQKLSSDSECSLSKQADIWYEECMIRYSDILFFSTVETRLWTSSCLLTNMSNPATSMPLLSDTMNQTAEEAAYAPSGDRYATKEKNVSEFQTIYSLAQCTRDLSPQDCRRCLTRAIGFLADNCEGSPGAKVLFPSCNIRYECYPFYRVPSSTAAGGLVPETNYRQKDSKYSEDPGYLQHNCSSKEAFATDSAFQLNLTTLLSYLSSNATDGQKFLHTDIAGTVYGLYLCRHDIPPSLCGLCVQNASHTITSECPSSQEAIIWYNYCMLRYSNQDLSSRLDTVPRFVMLNITSISNVNREYTFVLTNALAQMAQQTGDSVEKYQTESLKLNDYQTVYILTQCWRDLTGNDCRGCLLDVMGSAIPWSRLGSVGGRVLYPSCNLRFELFQFYNLEAPKVAAASPTGFYIWI